MTRIHAAALSLALVFLAPAVPSAAAPGDQPSRTGLDATRAPTATLPAALDAAPGALAAIAEHNLAAVEPPRDGFVRPLPEPRTVRLAAADLARPTPFEVGGGMVTRTPTGHLAWSGHVRVAEAHALRLHLAAIDVPPGTRAWTFADGGEAVEVPLDGIDLAAGAWTGVIEGGRAGLEVQVPVAALEAGAQAAFVLDEVLEVVRLDRSGRPFYGSEPVPKSHCFFESACARESFPRDTSHYQLAVAHLRFVIDGYQASCTGALLADTDRETRRPLLLTARHCIGSGAVASTVSARFRYWNDGCGGPGAAGRQVAGASLLASGAASDFALLELRRIPGGAGFLEWDERPSAAAPGTLLTLISHPFSRPQVFSRHAVIAGDGCAGAGFFSTVNVLGGTGPGASGAPVVNPAGRVVGQVHGGCGPNPGDGCRADTHVLFGRLSTTFPAIEEFLDPPPPEVDDGYLRSPEVPGFAFQVEIGPEGSSIPGTAEAECLPETLCVSGALPGRSEVFLRVVGPRPNGKLWPIVVKFTTSRVEVTIVQEATGDERHYVLPGATPGVDELPGLFDSDGFTPPG